MASGAAGGALGEVFVEAFTNVKDIAKDIQQRHPDLTENDVQKWHQLMKEETATTRTISKFASGIITGLFGGDFRTSYNAADNAIEHNFVVAAIPLLLLEAGIISVNAYRAYRVARGAYSLYNLAEKVQNKAKEQAKDQQQGGGGSGGGGDQRDPDEDPKDPKKQDGNFKTPKEFKDAFEKRKGRYDSKLDGSIWEKDTAEHGGEQFKRWSNKRSWERGDKPNSVWPNGSVRK
ncbi:MAG: hypothetical protein CNLJKLNK_01358 [Holosporales bacterium]